MSQRKLSRWQKVFAAIVSRCRAVFRRCEIVLRKFHFSFRLGETAIIVALFTSALQVSDVMIMHILFFSTVLVGLISTFINEVLSRFVKILLSFILTAVCLFSDYYVYNRAYDDGPGKLITESVDGPKSAPDGRVYITVVDKNNGAETYYDITQQVLSAFILYSQPCDDECVFRRIEKQGVMSSGITLEVGETSSYNINSFGNWQEYIPVVLQKHARIIFASSQYYRDKRLKSEKIYRKRTCYQWDWYGFSKCVGSETNSNTVLNVKSLKFLPSQDPIQTIQRGKMSP